MIALLETIVKYDKVFGQINVFTSKLGVVVA